VVVGAGIVVGAEVVVGSGVVVGAEVVVGSGVVVGTKVVVGSRVDVGTEVVVGSRVVVGVEVVTVCPIATVVIAGVVVCVFSGGGDNLLIGITFKLINTATIITIIVSITLAIIGIFIYR
jgi:UDP-3-O-[3-hydroxymyristoyl] glucosamine N-acyltransferase